VLRALSGDEPDRVPFVELAIDEPIAAFFLPNARSKPPRQSDDPDPGMVVRTMPCHSPYDPLALAERLELDAIGISMWVQHEGIEERAGKRTMLSGGGLRRSSDLDRLQLPDPSDERLYSPCRRFVEAYRDSGKALFGVLNLGSDPVILGMGFESFATALYDDRRFVEQLFSRYCNWYAEVASRLCELGLDFLWTTDDIAFKTSTYVSPRVFQDLFMPHYRIVADAITIPWIFHSDGDLRSILDQLLTLGMSGLHPIEPAAMDVTEIKRDYGDRVCLCGSIDVDLLGRGRPREVDSYVRRTIEGAAAGGGFICGSSNSIASYCEPENVVAMRDAILRYGAYS
jgi:uroporphyrinogen decarboxylase